MFKNHIANVIFLHIPKTGGNSVERAFSKCGGPIGRHCTLTELYEQFFKHWKGKSLKQYYIFTTVRNPFQRILSTFDHLKQGRFSGTKYVRSLTFKKYVQSIKKYFDDPSQYSGKQKITDKWGNTVFDLQHIRPFKKWVEGPKIDRLNLKVHILRFESLDTDWEKVHKQFKNVTMEKLPHINSKKKSQSHENYQKRYDDESRKIIETYYADELERFNYTF